MKKRKGFWHIGSFQLPHVFESEIPLEEVWAFIARYGTKDYIKNHLHSDNPEINWEDYVNYGMVSIVRYEPELMLEISHLDSEVGWLIDRFLTKAERFFPQLKICEQCKTTIYF